MYCPQCGTFSLSDAKFCFKCGSQLKSTEAAENGKLPYSSPTTSSIKPKNKTPSQFWLVFFAVAAVGAIGASMIPALVGKTIPINSLAAMLWSGVFGYVWWKRRSLPGWKGFLLGALLFGGAINVATHVIARYVQATNLQHQSTLRSNLSEEKNDGQAMLNQNAQSALSSDIALASPPTAVNQESGGRTKPSVISHATVGKWLRHFCFDNESYSENFVINQDRSATYWTEKYGQCYLNENQQLDCTESSSNKATCTWHAQSETSIILACAEYPSGKTRTFSKTSKYIGLLDGKEMGLDGVAEYDPGAFPTPLIVSICR